MRRNPFFFLIFILFASDLWAQIEIAQKFLYRSYIYNGMTIPYRIFVPENYNSSQKYPLVLALHGSGESGSDNSRQVNNYRLATVWADSINQLKYPCFVLAPQCPASGSWFTGFPVDRYPLPPEMEIVLKILDSLESVFNIDKNRLYITGLSLGGYGTWDIIARYPDKFAAAIPMSGGGDIQSIPSLLHMPIWNFHGRLDTSVPISESTRLFNEFIRNGRNVLYTHCSPIDCNGLADSSIERMISEGADLIHTEYQNGGHVIWDESYDYKYLLDWVFSQYKMENAIQILSPVNEEHITGIKEIKWHSVFSEGTVDIYFSENAGETWNLIAANYPNTGSYSWNTNVMDDCAFGQVRVILRDQRNIVRGYANSGFFLLNDPVKNGSPFIKILNGHFPLSTIITDKSFNLDLLLGDPESTTLTLHVEYSSDGINFNLLDSLELSDTGVRTLIMPVNIGSFQNSESAFLRVSCSDGIYSDTDLSYSFVKRTHRETVDDSKLNYISKYFEVPFHVNIADPGAIKNHEYLLTFDDISSETQKYFNVFDITDSKVVVNKQGFSPNNESSIFDGLSFTSEDVFTKSDLNKSSWNKTVSKKLTFTMNRFVLPANSTYNGYAKPNDYKIIFYNSIVDSSISDTLYPATSSNIFNARPVNFSVINMTTGEPVKFVYNTSGTISTTHSIWFFEELNGNKKRTWRVSIVDNEPNRTIPFGDTLYLYTYKGLSIYDSIKVLSNIVYVKNNVISENYYLSQNYPNPFNPKTTIRFGIASTGNVRLEIFNSLGEKVYTLLNKQMDRGEYDLSFDGSNFATGMYICRFESQGHVLIKKMLLLK